MAGRMAAPVEASSHGKLKSTKMAPLWPKGQQSQIGPTCVPSAPKSCLYTCGPQVPTHECCKHDGSLPKNVQKLVKGVWAF